MEAKIETIPTWWIEDISSPATSSARTIFFRSAGGDTAQITLRPNTESSLLHHSRFGEWSSPAMPKCWYEVSELKSAHTHRGKRCARDLWKFIAFAIPTLFRLAENAPLVLQCSRSHAIAYKRWLKSRLKILMGSLVNRPFEDKRFGHHEQIVMLLHESLATIREKP
jgi:hypothetical protein